MSAFVVRTDLKIESFHVTTHLESETSLRAFLGEAAAIRLEVFVDEQHVPRAEEFDVIDYSAVHFLAWQGEHAVGTARLVAPSTPNTVAHLGRLAIRACARGQSIGAALVQRAELTAVESGWHIMELDAQIQAQGFYERLGYQGLGPEFDDAGIPHRTMRRELAFGPKNAGFSRTTGGV